MENKLIIHNYTKVPHFIVLHYINRVIQKGMISKTKQGKQYCFVTMFKSGYVITCSRKNNTFTFKFYKEGDIENEDTKHRETFEDSV